MTSLEELSSCNSFFLMTDVSGLSRPILPVVNRIRAPYTPVSICLDVMLNDMFGHEEKEKKKRKKSD